MLLAILGGGVLGFVNPAAAVKLKPLGDGFIALVRMLISPVIFCTVVLGITGAGDMKKVGRVGGKQITTIEALEKDGKLHPLQEAFIAADAMQCAYCTSGMIMSASALLAKNAKPSRAEIITGMNGNICRCGTYERIVQAIQIASGQAKEVA